MSTVKSESDSGNEHTFGKYQTASKQIKAWAVRNQLVRLSQITPDALDGWKSEWKLKAKHPDDRIGKTTAGRRLEKVKGFLSYCVKMLWIIKSPAADLKAIKPDESVTLPLLSGRYEAVIASTYMYDGEYPLEERMVDGQGCLEAMRWA